MDRREKIIMGTLIVVTAVSAFAAAHFSGLNIGYRKVIRRQDQEIHRLRKENEEYGNTNIRHYNFKFPLPFGFPQGRDFISPQHNPDTCRNCQRKSRDFLVYDSTV